MKLGFMLQGLKDLETHGNLEQDIVGVTYDSRLVKPGHLFVALRGSRDDGHRYIQGALERGATAVVAEDVEGIPDGVAKVRVKDSRGALSKIALQFFRNPFKGLSVIGVTGTNGKTTTTYLLESILQVAGAKPGVLGTITYRYEGKAYPAPVTTPESVDIMRLAREMADAGVGHVVLEVSSHALDQGRTRDCPFRVAVFTNLSRDHLDYHGTMDEYFRAKSLLFSSLPGGGPDGPGTAVINLDDPRGQELLALTKANALTYGLNRRCRVRAESLEVHSTGLAFSLQTPAGGRKIRSTLLGDFNVYNIMAAAGAAVALGVCMDSVAEGVEALKTVPGRLEPVLNKAGLSLVVDYSHTPDSLLKGLQALRPHVSGKIITVFGCGGDRDRGKRPEMGHVAGKHSDVVLITSDNPRGEDPASIVEEVERGVIEAGLERREWPCHDLSERGIYFKEVDRRQAIRKAVHLAHKDDLVLIAGKGHEDYQIIGAEKRHFSDQEEALSAVENLG